MAEGLVNGEDEVSVGTVDQFKGHGSSPVIGVSGTAGGTKFGMAAKRDKFEIAAVGAAIHGAAKRGVTAVDDLFDVFHDDRSGFYVVFNDLIIIFQHFLYHIHEIIMKQSKAKNKPTPQD